MLGLAAKVKIAQEGLLEAWAAIDKVFAALEEGLISPPL